MFFKFITNVFYGIVLYVKYMQQFNDIVVQIIYANHTELRKKLFKMILSQK